MESKADYRQFSDAQLMDFFKSNDVNSFIEIFNRYWPPLVLHANRMLKDPDLAQDVVQEVFTHLYKQVEFNPNGSLASYLYRAVRNGVLDKFKHEKVKMKYAAEFACYVKDVGALADEELIMKELARAIESEIQKMPVKMKEIFELSRKEHLSQKEIAHLLGLSENTVNCQIQRALRKLDPIKGTLIFALVQLTD